jgi:hypothetical protein
MFKNLWKVGVCKYLNFKSSDIPFHSCASPDMEFGHAFVMFLVVFQSDGCAINFVHD